MYGGLVYELQNDSSKELFCEIFISKNHVTVELARGAELQDPENLHEGLGKQRRHLILHSISEIETRHIDRYVDLASLLARGAVSP